MKKCCAWDTDNDGNCAIHLAPGVLRPRYRGLSEPQAANQWKRENYLRNYSNDSRRTMRIVDAVWTQSSRRVNMIQGFTYDHYRLDELWPYKGFVKPIRELATPHLKNIVELFTNDPSKFDISSEGKLRDPVEVMQLRHRVALVKEVLKEREAKEATEKHTNLSRRILDTKIQISALRSRASQMFNQPDADEYQKMLTHCLSLLIDIQNECSL